MIASGKFGRYILIFRINGGLFPQPLIDSSVSFPAIHDDHLKSRIVAVFIKPGVLMLRSLRRWWGDSFGKYSSAAAKPHVPQFESLSGNSFPSARQGPASYRPMLERLEERVVPSTSGDIGIFNLGGPIWTFRINADKNLAVQGGPYGEYVAVTGGAIKQISVGTTNNNGPTCFYLTDGGEIWAYLPQLTHNGAFFDLGGDPGVTQILAFDGNAAGVWALAGGNVWEFDAQHGWRETVTCNCVDSIAEGAMDSGLSFIFARTGGNVWQNDANLDGWNLINNSGAVTAMAAGDAIGFIYVIQAGNIFADFSLHASFQLTSGAQVSQLLEGAPSTGGTYNLLAIANGNIWEHFGGNVQPWGLLTDCGCVTDLSTSYITGDAAAATSSGALWHFYFGSNPLPMQLEPDGSVL